MWTQMAKADKGAGVETNQLFFDSESRQVQSDLDSEGNAEQAKALAMQAQLVGVINKLQQRKQDDNGFDHVRNSFGGKGVASGKHTHIPPEVPPAVFALPKVCILLEPTLSRPYAHSACRDVAGPRDGAVGRPAADGPRRPRAAHAHERRALRRRLRLPVRPSVLGPVCQQVNRAVRSQASNCDARCQLLISMTPPPHRLSLLNSTVTSLAKSINEILTECYAEIYQEDDSDVTLELITAPLAASEEVLALFQGGVAPAEVAVPACLHAIGASREQIEDAVKQAVEERKRLRDNEQNTADGEKTSKEHEHKGKEQEHAANEARIVVELEQAKANVDKTKAEAIDIRRPDPAPAPAAKKAKKS